MLPYLNHHDIFLRKDTVNLLKDVGTARSLPALQALADTDDNFIQESAKAALAAVQARVRR